MKPEPKYETPSTQRYKTDIKNNVPSHIQCDAVLQLTISPAPSPLPGVAVGFGPPRPPELVVSIGVPGILVNEFAEAFNAS
jgi:hypothetical protein